MWMLNKQSKPGHEGEGVSDVVTAEEDARRLRGQVQTLLAMDQKRQLKLKFYFPNENMQLELNICKLTQKGYKNTVC